jgi:hypothetical protein
MKRRFICLTTLLLLSGVASAINPQWVRLTSSLSNEKGVKFVAVEGKDHHPTYSLACNDRESDCVTPDTGIWYTLASYAEGKYSNRENVILLLNGKMVGNYWLEASAE